MNQTSLEQVTPILEARNLSFAYPGSQILTDLSFQIHSGDFAGLIGANGAGKSTLIRLLLGQLKPARGEVFLFGKPIQNFRDWHRIAYIPQKANAINQDFPISVEELVALPLTCKSFGRLKRKAIREAVHEALTIVKMLDYAKRPIGCLSGGQQQRVFIAKSLVHQPELLLLDEPTVGIDLVAEREIYDLLQHLNQVHGMSILWVSHDLTAVANRSDRLFCLGASGFFEHSCSDPLGASTLERIYGRSFDPSYTHHVSCHETHASPQEELACLRKDAACGLHDQQYLEKLNRRS